MRKTMMLAAVVAMVMLLAATAMAQTTDGSIVQECDAVLNQSNEGSQYAVNEATQDADADQYQYQPGGAGGTGGAGGAGGTGSQYQYQNQRQDQEATATGPTFDAEQIQYCSNVVARTVR